MVTLLGAAAPMTMSPPAEYRPRTLMGFDVGSAGFGGVWYWTLPEIMIEPEAAIVVCSFCCRVPLTPVPVVPFPMLPLTKIMLALVFPGPCHPLGTPMKIRVVGPDAAPGQPPPEGGDSHALLVTVVWLFTRSTVTVVVVVPWASV